MQNDSLEITTAKSIAASSIDEQANGLIQLSKDIWNHPESGFRERRTAKKTAEYMKLTGLETRENVAMTGVIAKLDTGRPGPHIAIMGELDSLIVPEHRVADAKTGAAHVCGHNIQIGNMLAAAVGLSNPNVIAKLNGSISFMAVPAEEYIEIEYREKLRDSGEIEFLSGKQEFIRLGELQNVQISLLTYMATMQTLSDIDPEPIGNAHFVHVPYNSFTTQNGFVVIAVITDAFWEALLNVVNVDSLRDSKFSNSVDRLKNQEFIEAELNKILSTKPSEFWIKALNDAKVPCGPINTFSQALSDEQVIHRNMVVEVEHPDGGKVKMPGNPVKLSYTNEDSYTPPPHLGKDTKEILKEWAGYDEIKIKSLIDKNIVQSID